MKSVACVLGAAVAFGTVSVLARDAYRHGAEPLSLLGVRVFVPALLLTLVVAAFARPRAADLRRGGLAACVLGGVAFALAGLGEFEALSRAPAPLVILLVFVAPVWVALASWALWGDKPSGRVVAGIAITIAGLALVVGKPGEGEVDATAAAFGLGASVLGASFYLVLARSVGRVAPVPAAAIAAWTATIVVFVVEPGGAFEELSRQATAGHAVAIGVLSACGLTLLVVALNGTSALATSAVIAVEPLVTAALSWVFLDEGLGPSQLAGAAAVLVGVTLLAAATSRPAAVTGP